MVLHHPLGRSRTIIEEDHTKISPTSTQIPAPLHDHQIFRAVSLKTYFLVNTYTGRTISYGNLSYAKRDKTKSNNLDWYVDTRNTSGDRIFVPLKEETWKIYQLNTSGGLTEIEYRSKSQHYPHPK